MNPTLHKTQNNLPEPIRRKSIDLLNQHLADGQTPVDGRGPRAVEGLRFCSSFLATLGFKPESRWDSSLEFPNGMSPRPQYLRHTQNTELESPRNPRAGKPAQRTKCLALRLQ